MADTCKQCRHPMRYHRSMWSTWLSLYRCRVWGAAAMAESEASPQEPATVIDEAAAIIKGSRRTDYGPVDESFGRIADMWMAYLGHPVTGHDVAMMMILLKVCRARQGVKFSGRPQRDSLVDIIGYAALSEEMGL